MSTLPRRNILKAAAATALGATLASSASAQDRRAASGEPKEWGGWLMSPSGNKHMPVVTTERHGEEALVNFVVKHPQGAEHHISNVRIYDKNRLEIATAEFNPTLSTPKASMTLRVAAGTKLFAVTNCNKHGLWYTEFTV